MKHKWMKRQRNKKGLLNEAVCCVHRWMVYVRPTSRPTYPLYSLFCSERSISSVFPPDFRNDYWKILVQSTSEMSASSVLALLHLIQQICHKKTVLSERFWFMSAGHMPFETLKLFLAFSVFCSPDLTLYLSLDCLWAPSMHILMVWAIYFLHHWSNWFVLLNT